MCVCRFSVFAFLKLLVQMGVLHSMEKVKPVFSKQKLSCNFMKINKVLNHKDAGVKCCMMLFSLHPGSYSF